MKISIEDSSCGYMSFSDAGIPSPSMASPTSANSSFNHDAQYADQYLSPDQTRVLSFDGTGNTEESLGHIRVDVIDKKYRRVKCCAALLGTTLLAAAVLAGLYASHTLKF